MSPRLALYLLGPPLLELDNAAIAADRRKAVALVSYLAMNRGKHTREFVSSLLWPDYDQSKAFTNLRHTLWEVQQAIGEGWIVADRESIRAVDENIWLDVHQFQSLLDQSRAESDPSLRISLLSDAVKLYRNHFLTGFSLRDAYPFNEWVFDESENLRQKLANALAILSQDYCALGQANQAIPHARRMISLDPLNEAAHRQLMEVYLQAGQHGAALKQYQTCEQILRKELNLDPQPETRALYKKIRKREMQAAPMAEQKPSLTPQHNLPSQISSFIGREKEQSEIVNLIKKNRLVTLAGVGGIGKTRLALQVGQRLLNDYPDGVWFVALDSLSDPVLVPQTVASAFEISESPDRPIIEILMDVLREKTTLLILDNCEHLLEACTKLITTLLQNSRNLRILTTSREVLGISGEATYYIPSLSIPEQEKTSIEKLTEYEAIQLFTERAALALSSFLLTKENAKTILDICHRLDGIPLAIELAAARVYMLQVKEIKKQLEHSFSMLSSDSHSTIPRHQTLRASIDWSWGLLRQAEQIFLRQLSVFAGGWTLESAEAVCEGDTFELIGTLIKKSLIVVDQQADQDTRYRFHEVIRQYAREKLVEAGEEETVRSRHMEYFLQFSGQAESALNGPAQIEWYVRLHDGRDNIRSALEWAAQNNLVEAGLYLSGRLRRFWESFDLKEGARWLAEFTERPESKAFPQARAKALYAQVGLLLWMLQFERAHATAQECLQLYRRCGDPYGEIDGLLVSAETLYIFDEPPARELAQQALALSESLGDIQRRAASLKRIGESYHDLKHSSIYWEKAISLYRQLKDWLSLADCLSERGNQALLNGEIQGAEEYLKEATSLSRQLTNKNLLAGNLQVYGHTAFSRGDSEEALASIKESIEISRETGHRVLYFWSYVLWGYITLQQGNVTQAREILTKSIREFFDEIIEVGIVFALEGMASLFVVVNKPENAARLIGWADITRQRLDDQRPLLEQANVDQIIAACLARMGEVAFSDAYDEGQKMTLEEAVTYALNEG